MKIWMIFDPRRALIGLAAFLLVLALLIHFILLGTSQYNWLQGSGASSQEIDVLVPLAPAGMQPNASTMSAPGMQPGATMPQAQPGAATQPMTAQPGTTQTVMPATPNQ